MSAVATTITDEGRRTAIKLVFLTHAVASGSFLTRIPDLQQGLGIDAATLGLAMIGQPVGAIGMFLVSSRIIEASGTRNILLLCLPLLALCALLMALAPSALLLFAAIAVFSATFALTNVTMNVEADRVEAATGRRLMNTCHGIWSMGQLGVLLLGVLARGWNITPVWHFAAMLPPVLLATMLIVLPMAVTPARDHVGGQRRRLALPSLATVQLLGFAIGGALLEAATRNWSVIYARDSFAAPDWADVLTLPFFVGAVAIGRFFADSWTHRIGPARLAAALLLIAGTGLVIVISAPSLPIALMGFVLMGFGVCTSFPASASAAAQLGDRPSSENVAALTLSVQFVLLGAPPLMGFVADAWGIRATFVLVAPALLLAFLLSGSLRPRVGR